MGYFTLKKEAYAELTEKRSRFLARVCPVKSEEEALMFLESIRRDHTATHHVFAYRLRENNFARYNDDGEPGGTAGLPVLDVLERGGLTDAIIVVSRWFGGTLLGTGGLVRAYSSAAKMGVQAAGIVEMEMAGKYHLNVSYSDYDRVMRIARECGVSISYTDFKEDVFMEIIATDGPAFRFSDSIRELTRGKNEMILQEKEYLPIGEKRFSE